MFPAGVPRHECCYNFSSFDVYIIPPTTVHDHPLQKEGAYASPFGLATGLVAFTDVYLCLRQFNFQLFYDNKFI